MIMASTSPIVLASACSVGEMIKFCTLNPNDLTIYSGKVIGIVDFERARVYGDVSAMHLAMEQGYEKYTKQGTDPAKLQDVTQQKFLIVALTDGSIVPYAFEWLCDSENKRFGNVTRIEQGSTYTIRLYNVDASSASTALDILKSNGYVCRLIKDGSTKM